jgi:hypothetical protein
VFSAVITSVLVCVVQLFIWYVAVCCVCVCVPQADTDDIAKESRNACEWSMVQRCGKAVVNSIKPVACGMFR